MLSDEPRQPAPRRILVVEDNELNLKLLADLLDFHGYSIVVAGLGESALDIASQQLPDLVLLDIQLPDISGTEVARRLKADQRTRAIPIIAVTAFAMSGDRANILASGCDEYVSKPIRLPEFLELVARYVGRPTTRDRRQSRTSEQRRGADRRTTGDRRVTERRSGGSWTGIERRSGERRQDDARRREGSDRRAVE